MPANDRTPFYRRLSVQVGLTVALVSGIALGITVWFVASQQRATLTNELTLRLLAESRSLSLATAGPLLRHDPELGLHPLIVKALSETPDLTELVVLDLQRTVQGHRDMLQVGTHWPATRDATPLKEIQGHAEEKVLLSAAGEVIIETPIRHLDRTIGWLYMRASRRGIEATVNAAQRRLLFLGGSGTLLSILFVLLLVTINLRPLGDLRRGVNEIGSGNLNTRIRVLSRNELGSFATLINSMAAGLEKAQHELIQKERLDHELEIARELQSILLPRELKPAPGYSLDTHYTPALEVSGDYYDILPLDEQHIAFVTADVSGKGIPALVVMAMFRSILRSVAAAGISPIDVMVSTSGMLRGSMSRGMFVTCLYGILDTRGHRFQYVSAGHCPPALFSSKNVRYLEAGGKPMGLFSESVLKKSLILRAITLNPGEGLLLYTDGLIEALDPKANRLGTEAVLQQLRACGRAHVQEVVAALRQRVDAHRRGRPESDDLTLLAFQRQYTRAPQTVSGRSPNARSEVTP